MTGVHVREASTVILLRDSADGLQAWLLRRVATMAFAARATVFPGGSIDPIDLIHPTDAVAGSAESGEHIAAVAAQLETSVEHAAVLLRAAARETLEETDVALPMTALRPWARWITPASEPRRYNTYFFVAGLPLGEVAAPVSSEASEAGWILVAQALAEWQTGSRPMLPPTIANLSQIGTHAAVTQVLAAAPDRSLTPVEPVLSRAEDGWLVADIGDGQPIRFPAP